MARRPAREPGEPKRDDEVPWHCPGMGGPSRIARVERESGRWSRVMLRWQAGCEPGPAYDGQPEDQWTCPVGSEWLTRAEFEEGQRRWAAQSSPNASAATATNRMAET